MKCVSALSVVYPPISELKETPVCFRTLGVVRVGSFEALLFLDSLLTRGICATDLILSLAGLRGGSELNTH